MVNKECSHRGWLLGASHICLASEAFYSCHLSLQPYVCICRENTEDTKACEMQSAAGGGGAAAHMLD